MSREIDQGVDATVKASTERGYDLDGMVAAGGSAGGTLAMIYGYRDAADSLVPVEAVMNFVGPASFGPADWFGMEEDYASEEAAEAGAGLVSIITGQEITPEMMRSGEYREALEPVTAEMLVGEDSRRRCWPSGSWTRSLPTPRATTWSGSSPSTASRTTSWSSPIPAPP